MTIYILKRFIDASQRSIIDDTNDSFALSKTVKWSASETAFKTQRNNIDLTRRFDHIFSALCNRTSKQLIFFRFSTLTEFFIANFKLDSNKKHTRDLKIETKICRSHKRFEKNSYKEHSIKIHDFLIFSFEGLFESLLYRAWIEGIW